MDNFKVPVAVVLSYSRAVHGKNIILITEKSKKVYMMFYIIDSRVVPTKRILWTSSICGEIILKISLFL